ncbi:MAG: hypothetical protein ABEN55_04050 [Bradymonadaceae bacterium]
MNKLKLTDGRDTLEFDPGDSPIVLARMDRPPQGEPLGGEWETLRDVRFLRGSATTENKHTLLYEDDRWVYRPAYSTEDGDFIKPIDFILKECPNFPFDCDLEHTIE